ncbi:MAG: MFS transporter [Candidatus Eiseniibacteriota bacterium]
MTATEAATRDDDVPVRLSLARLVLVVFLPFAGGYFLSYLYRSVNAVIAPHLVAEVGLTAADLGLLTAVFFFGFALPQIPLGLLLDRFGPRRVQSTQLLVAALGALWFALAHDKLGLIGGRMLIGIGMAGCLMASFKAITLWFPAERWPLVNGLLLGAGGVGAMVATKPVELMLSLTDWRGIFFGVSAATVVLAALTHAIVPEKPTEAHGQKLGTQFLEMKVIFRDRYFWRLAPLGTLTMGAGMAIQGLWSAPWLRDIAHLSQSGVADYLLATTAAMTVGFAGVGVATDVLRRYGVSAFTVMTVGATLFIVSQAAMVFEVDPTGLWIWLLFGVTNNVTVLSYPLLSRHFPLRYAGRANGALNLLVFAGAFIAQYAIGGIIGLWPAGAKGGYAPEAYPVAFGIFLALQIAAFLWLLVPGRRVTDTPDRAASRSG